MTAGVAFAIPRPAAVAWGAIHCGNEITVHASPAYSRRLLGGSFAAGGDRDTGQLSLSFAGARVPPTPAEAGFAAGVFLDSEYLAGGAANAVGRFAGGPNSENALDSGDEIAVLTPAVEKCRALHATTLHEERPQCLHRILRNFFAGAGP